jgi:hypothetical protein
MNTPNRPIRILSLNCHRNSEVVFSILNTTAPNSNDILCLQELPDDIETRHAYRSTAWTPIFPPTHLPRSQSLRIRSCIYISSLIPSDSYRTNLINSLDIASITITHSPTPLTIYSIYNPPDSDSTIDSLHQSLSAPPVADHHLLITGDFNKHHTLWSGPLAPLQCFQCSDCDSLLHLASDYALHQCLPPGTPTFYSAPHDTWTTIDLTFISSEIADQVLSCTTSDSHGSDHLSIQTMLKLPLVRHPISPRPLFRATDWEDYASRVVTHFTTTSCQLK